MSQNACEQVVSAEGAAVPFPLQAQSSNTRQAIVAMLLGLVGGLSLLGIGVVIWWNLTEPVVRSPAPVSVATKVDFHEPREVATRPTNLATPISISTSEVAPSPARPTKHKSLSVRKRNSVPQNGGTPLNELMKRCDRDPTCGADLD